MINIETLRVDSNVPLPTTRTRGGSGLAQLFKKLKPGDSVFIPIGNTFKPSSLTSMCHTAAKNANVRVTIRKSEECPTDGPTCDYQQRTHREKSRSKNDGHTPVLGFRVWRIDDPADKTAPDGPRVVNKTKGKIMKPLSTRMARPDKVAATIRIE